MTRSKSGATRRALVAAGAALPLTAGYVWSGTDHRHRLWYSRPAGRWEEALPVGNGRLGAMVFGRVAQERLQLNEDTLWAGSPYTPDNPEALAALPEVRRLIDEGRFAEASDLASAKMMAKPLWQMAYGSLGDLLIDFPGAKAPETFERDLDIGEAVTKVRYAGKGFGQTREVFASAVDQVIVMRLEAKAGHIDAEFSYRGPRKATYTSPAYDGAATDLSAPPADWLIREAASAPREDVVFTTEGAGWLIAGRNEAGPDTAAGLTFAISVRVISDGEVRVEGETIHLMGARSATVLIGAATSFVRYDDVSGDAATRAREATSRAAAKSYAELRRAHVADYRQYYDRFSLDLGSSAAAHQETSQRVHNGETSDDPALSALYLQYARYLLISSSRPGTQAANLQGIWNEGVNPPWGSKYTININTEMNYWPAFAAGLPEMAEPLLRLAEELSVTGAKTAKTMYGARGWVAHHNTDLWRAAAPIDGPNWGLWPCGGAWLCVTLWDYYDYTRDARVLERLWPLLSGASAFFLDTLVEDPKGRGLITSPSVSPENPHPFGAAVCAGPAMDRQIVRDLFARTIEAASLLGRDAELAEALVRTSARIAPDRIGQSGQFQEWLEDWDAQAPDFHHRHVSHLYGLYPSGQYNVRDTPEFAEAARVSLQQRGDYATGWGTAWRLCLWARLGEGAHAHDILRMLTGAQRTYPNMFDAHPPFQIDGNFGGAAGIMEMLVQSWGGEVRLLPALPPQWPSGSVRGLRVRGGLSLDMNWDKGAVSSLRLTGTPGAEVVLREGARLSEVRLDQAGQFRR